MNVIQHAWVSFVLSVAETLILYWLCSNFLHRNLRPMSQYTVGILIYFIFQWVTYWFNAPLFSMCVFYCAFTMLVSCIFFTDSLRTKVRCPQLCLQAAVRSAVAFSAQRAPSLRA